MDLLEEAVELGYSKDITVVDMAPETEEIEGKSIGGRLSELTEASEKVRYLTPNKVEMPRLKATSAEHLLSMVQINAERIKPLLETYLVTPSPILFVNDISIYLQSGSLEIVLEAARQAETFIANGYYGEFFSNDHGTGVSKIERDLMDRLASHMDEVIRLTSQRD
ncbi:MAG: hypothetical protein NWF12_06295 [Candidatus Bathyarchaeota archaeon]|nr:hypothetical protein [Candidatus Bathyarchaeota archaeon]